MTANTPDKPDEESVLLAFSVEPQHDRETLARYLTEYPEHTNALIDCSLELMMDAVRVDADDMSAVNADAVVDKARQRFQALLTESGGVSVSNPFGKLNRAGYKSLANKLNISNLLLIRLRDRAIDAASLPARFVDGLAAELGASAEAVMDYLCSPPAMVSGQSFRSSVKPKVGDQMSFAQAIETSQLSPEQQNALKALMVE